MAGISRAGPTQAETPVEDNLAPWSDQIYQWLTGDRLKVTRVRELLAARGSMVSYTSLRGFIRKRNWGRRSVRPVRMADTESGEVAEVDFGRLGMITDPATGKRGDGLGSIEAITRFLRGHRHFAVPPGNRANSLGPADITVLTPLVAAAHRDPGTRLAEIRAMERLYGLSGRVPDALPLKNSSMWLKTANSTLSAPRRGPAFVLLARVAALAASAPLPEQAFTGMGTLLLPFRACVCLLPFLIVDPSVCNARRTSVRV